MLFCVNLTCLRVAEKLKLDLNIFGTVYYLDHLPPSSHQTKPTSPGDGTVQLVAHLLTVPRVYSLNLGKGTIFFQELICKLC
jgi:hypothetical protein